MPLAVFGEVGLKTALNPVPLPDAGEVELESGCSFMPLPGVGKVVLEFASKAAPTAGEVELETAAGFMLPAVGKVVLETAPGSLGLSAVGDEALNSVPFTVVDAVKLCAQTTYKKQSVYLKYLPLKV